MTPTPITDELLVAYLLGEATQEAAEVASAAMTASPEVAERAERLRATLSSLSSLEDDKDAFSISDVQISRLAALMRGRQRAWFTQIAERAHEVVATVVFDTLRNPAPELGFRGSAISGRLIRASADGVDVDLRVSDGPERDILMVQGQISPTGMWSSVRAFDPESDSAVVGAIASDGYFELELTQGMYRLEFVSTRATVVIESLTIRPPDAESP